MKIFDFFADLIQLDKLPAIAYSIEVAQELLFRDNHRASAIVGVEREALGILKIVVQKEVGVVLLVVDKSERRYRTRLQAQISLHTLW